MGKVAAEIPYYQTNGALVEIKQQRISYDGYQFLKLLKEQGQNTGTLVDTLPEDKQRRCERQSKSNWLIGTQAPDKSGRCFDALYRKSYTYPYQAQWMEIGIAYSLPLIR